MVTTFLGIGTSSRIAGHPQEGKGCGDGGGATTARGRGSEGIGMSSAHRDRALVAAGLFLAVTRRVRHDRGGGCPGSPKVEHAD
jgi:hypothetical protein